MAKKPVPVVLIGCGKMGRNHLRVMSENSSYQLVGVVDPAVSHDTLGLDKGIPIFDNLVELDKSGVAYDAAVIATSTETHFEVAQHLLGLGKHLLVEKPLASTVAQSEELGRLAEKAGVVLAVGHVERYNPAVRKLREVLNSGWLGDPIHFSVTRVGGYPHEVKPGNNVLLDLAVHDIDVLRSMLGPMRVVANYCHKTIKQDVFDTGEILLASETGVSASVHVNWITPTKIRTIRVTGSKGVCFVDYMMQTCELMGGNLLQEAPNLKQDFQSLQAQYASSDRIAFGIQKSEPLKIEHQAFLDALAGDASEICGYRDGAAAVQLAEAALVSVADFQGEGKEDAFK